MPNVSYCEDNNEVHYNPDPFNGHAYVDLGLPSGTKWATMNVGASSITDYGLYFSWGGTTGYADASTKVFSWADYELGDGNMTKYNSTDGLTTLEAVDDAATVNMGGDWHMPSAEQIQELLNTSYVTNAWVTDYNGSGVNGRLFTSVADNTKTLFIPASGDCSHGSVNNVGGYGFVWSQSLYESNVLSGRFLDFDSGNAGLYNDNRYYGQSVRGVVG